LIVVNIAANYFRYSVRVFANASKRLDIHQHTERVQVTARQLWVQFVPHREHPVWIRPITGCHVKVQCCRRN